MPVPPLDLRFTRTQFPAFSEPAFQERAFFENAGGSFPCLQVVDRLTRFYRSSKVQPYHPFPASRQAGEEMDEARERLARLLNVAESEISFGPSTTANTYVLAQAFRSALAPGEAIVVTDQDHEANSGPWRRLAEDGIDVREWKIDPETGHLDPTALEPLLADGRVRLVCFPHCSNVVAEINPVAEITAQIHKAGALACVDGVSYAPHGLPDVQALGADIYLISAYKTYGPHQGIMVIRTAVSGMLPNQGHWFNGDTPWKRFTPAGPDHAQVAGCAGIADYIDTLHAHHFQREDDPVRRSAQVHDLLRAQEMQVMRPLLAYLHYRTDLRLLGPIDPTRRAPTFAVALGQPAAPVAAALSEQRIDCAGGDFYARRPLQAMGVNPADGVLRMSMVHYTSPEDVVRLIAALERVLPSG